MGWCSLLCRRYLWLTSDEIAKVVQAGGKKMTKDSLGDWEKAEPAKEREERVEEDQLQGAAWTP